MYHIIAKYPKTEVSEKVVLWQDAKGIYELSVGADIVDRVNYYETAILIFRAKVLMIEEKLNPPQAVYPLQVSRSQN